MKPSHRWLLAGCAGLLLFLGVAGMIQWQERTSTPSGTPAPAAPMVSETSVILPEPESAPAGPPAVPAQPDDSSPGHASDDSSSESDLVKELEQQGIITY